MDPRLYIYELRRPRVANPTYNSSNVNTTCFSIYSGGPLQASSPHHVTSSLNLPRTDRLPNPHPKQQSRSRASSNLSNYGSSVLRLQDKDVYRKQSQKFNIISMQPVSHDETIKKYPKLTLEDKDALYFQKMAQNLALKQQQQHPQQLNAAAKQEQSFAGKQTYGIQGDKVALNLWQSYGSGHKNHGKFTPKMLNHVDEFRSLI